jgi:outer membrane protein TolC
MTHRMLLAVLLSSIPWVASAAPQATPAAGPLDLASLQAAAIARDPRLREIDLQDEATDLRLETISAERLPTIAVEGRAQHQSDVPKSPFAGPGGAPLFAPPKDTFDATVRVDIPLLDPSREPRLDVERARRDQAQAQVRTALYGLRQEVNAAFFAAALLAERRRAIETAVTDLQARLDETSARVREGTAIPAEGATIDAALVERRQDLAEIDASRRAALARLEELTGRRIGEDEELEMPNLAAAVEEARGRLAELRARPEYDQFARTQELLRRQQDTAGAIDRPRVSGFATGGVGRPGLNFIDSQVEGYWLAGLRMQWTAWGHGASGREREELSRQQAIVGAEEEAFTARLRRAIEDDLANIDRLAAGGALDDRLIELRMQIVRSATVQLQEGALTSAEYVDRNTDLLNAGLARGRHRVELAQASAELLTTLGLEVR